MAVPPPADSPNRYSQQCLKPAKTCCALWPANLLRFSNQRVISLKVQVLMPDKVLLDKSLVCAQQYNRQVVRTMIQVLVMVSVMVRRR